MKLPKYRLFDYETPGKGVPKDAPKKKGVALFFDIFHRRFWKMVSLNAIYLVLSIPCFIVLWFIVYSLLTLMSGTLMLTEEGKQLMETVGPGAVNFFEYVDEGMASTITQIATYLSVLIYSLFGGGAVTSGITYVLRNYAVDTHSWMWSDFKAAAKKNFKRSTVVFIVDIIFLTLLTINFWFYGSLAADNVIAYVLQGLMVLLFLIFLLMHAYIYPILISYDKKVSRVYKDAFILAMGKLPTTFFSMLICFIVAAAVTFLACFVTVYAMLIIPIILFTLVTFINLFITYPVVQKYLGEYEI